MNTSDKWWIAQEPRRMMDELDRAVIDSSPSYAVDIISGRLPHLTMTYHELANAAWRCTELIYGVREVPHE